MQPPDADGCVLIVDDDPIVRHTFAEMLRTAGFATLDTHSGRDGLALLRAQAGINLVLLDLSMPGMDGFAFRAEQMSDADIACIPVVVISGSPISAQDRSRLQAARYLAKPVQRGELISTVRECLGDCEHLSRTFTR
jgi:two-component system response regulator MprA